MSFGTIGLNPFKGRCHLKVFIVDNTVFSFGGVNFAKVGFEYSDYMIRLESTWTANLMTVLVRDVQVNKIDQLFQFDDSEDAIEYNCSA